MIVGEEEILIKPLYLVLMKNQLGNIKECRTLIRHHHVDVNGKTIDDIDYLVNEDDVITVNQKRIHSHPYVYYMMNKPSGYICANHDVHYPCVVDLLDIKDVSCLGRLDKETTGLLILTNDRSLVKQLLLPQNHIEKRYFVTVKKPLKENLKDRFSQGIIIDFDVQCLPSYIDIIDDYHCYVTLYEGKYHQIKKMFLSCDNEVIELKRVSFAGICLDERLKQGDYRQLTKEEFQKLKEMSLSK